MGPAPRRFERYGRKILPTAPPQFVSLGNSRHRIWNNHRTGDIGASTAGITHCKPRGLPGTGLLNLGTVVGKLGIYDIYWIYLMELCCTPLAVI